MYESLNDAACYNDAFKRGARFAIWYIQPQAMTSLMATVSIFGIERAKSQYPNLVFPTNLDCLQQTHRLLGCIAGQGQSMETLFNLTQGENWSPNGEANTLIQRLGLNHTSMSCSDVIVDDGDIYMVDQTGFVRLGHY